MSGLGQNDTGPGPSRRDRAGDAGGRDSRLRRDPRDAQCDTICADFGRIAPGEAVTFTRFRARLPCARQAWGAWTVEVVDGAAVLASGSHAEAGPSPRPSPACGRGGNAALSAHDDPTTGADTLRRGGVFLGADTTFCVLRLYSACIFRRATPHLVLHQASLHVSRFGGASCLAGRRGLACREISEDETHGS
jgi:hypothetical protein